MSRYDYDLIVIGTGAGGSTAAHIVAATGKKVAIVEANEFGGECPNWADVPTKAMLHVANIYSQVKQATRFGIRSATMGYNYPTIRAWKEQAVARTGTARGKAVFESEGINVLRGRAEFISPHQITVGRRYYSAAYFLIATGATDAPVPIEGLDSVPYLTNRQALELNRPPKSLFIIGGGATAMELAELLHTFGSKITIAEARPRLLPHEDSELGAFLTDHFSAQGLNILTHAKVTKIEKETYGKRVFYRVGAEEHSLKVDDILLAAGKKPAMDMGLDTIGIEYNSQGIVVDDFLQTNVPHIFAAGDVLGGHMSTHKAIYQSRLSAHNILHRQKLNATYVSVPRVVFTNPEVAAVGVSEEEALKYAFKFRTARTPLSVIGRANMNDSYQGFVKLIINEQETLIGGAIAAPHASEMIHELALGIKLGAKASDIADTVHAFPTWSEATRITGSKLG